MMISLARLPVAGLRFEHQYEANELDVSAHDFVVTVAPRIAGHLRQAGMDVHLTGDLKATIVVPCDRCLQDVPFALEQPLKLVYVPVNAESALKGEKELHEAELEFSYYDNDEIDIDQLIREQLELALPVQVLCKQDCRGLCAQCGAELNLETCQCSATIDPRWQALAELKDQFESND